VHPCNTFTLPYSVPPLSFVSRCYELIHSPLKKKQKDDTTAVFQPFLKNLLEITGLAGVVWKPNQLGTISGEVKNGVVYIYEYGEDTALQTLRHEIVDYHISSRLIRPLIGIINSLIKSREAEIYKKKEKKIEQLSKLLEKPGESESQKLGMKVSF